MAGSPVKFDYIYTAERGTVWGTAKDVNPLGIPTEEMTIGQEATAHYIARAKGIRGQLEENTFQNTSNSLPAASFACPASPAVLKNLLPAMLQNGTDWTAATNVWTLFTHNCSGMPLPVGSNTGYYYTLVQRNDCDATNSWRISSALMSTLKLSIARPDNEGVLWMDTEWLGKTFSRGVTVTGVVSHMSISGHYDWDNITSVAFGSTDLTSEFVSAEWNITAGAKPIRDIPTAEFVFPLWEVEGTMVLSESSDIPALITKVYSREVNNAESLKIQWGAGTVDADGELYIDCNAYLTSVAQEKGDDGNTYSFGFRGTFGANPATAAGENPITIKFFAT